MEECEHCEDWEGYPIELHDEGFCPVCGHEAIKLGDIEG